MEDKLTLRQKLQKIQLELSVPKNQRNSFGNYNYRSCEDILEALKPLLEKYGCLITIGDKIIQVGERYYVLAQVCLKDADSEAEVFTEALAREEECKKGMDGSQITGASSSYARKYALNGLFGIDDTKDSDTTNVEAKKSTPELVREPTHEFSNSKCPKCGGPIKMSKSNKPYCPHCVEEYYKLHPKV